MGDLPLVERLQVAEIRPDGTVIVTLPESATPEDMERFADAFKERFAGNEVLIVSDGVEVSVRREVE